jgi:1-acyl-sn-glycerol-3-phosphate acyltransferase
MPTLRAFAMALVFVGLTLVSIPVQYVALCFRPKLLRSYSRRYQRGLCWLFGIRITVVGTPVRDRAVLMVANHTGYFDVIIMGSTVDVSFVAKSEVSAWPFFGMMARLQRSVFIERAKRSHSGVARDVLRERLRDGDGLVLFPEGTSTDGNRVLPFKSALMGAVEADIGTGEDGQKQYAPVQPVSISYVALHGIPLGRENRPLFAWYGDMDLLPHVWEALKAGPLDVIVEFHPPLTVGPTCGRKQIAVAAEAIVREGQRRALSGDWGAANRDGAGGNPPAEAAA